MEADILNDSDAPLCPSCSKPMRFVRAIPRFAALPELRTYECKPCGVTHTAAVTPDQDADVGVDRARGRSWRGVAALRPRHR